MDEEQSQFIGDAREIVEKLYSDLDQLRSARSQGRRRRELAARIFRRVHTLKGSAGSLGLKSVSLIAHDFEGVLDGVRLVRSELSSALARLGVESFSPLGESFDPVVHEAMATVEQPSGGPASGEVVEVYQPGYRLGESVIRPARVVVAA